MEKADFSYAPFTVRSMIPEAGDEVTIPWGRRLAYNLINGFGLIGTVSLSPRTEQIVNFDLTRKFQFPPSLYCYFNGKSNLSGLPEMNYTMPFRHYPTFRWFIDNDCVHFQNFSSYSMDVYFRIHGD
jgi:hypothetical protein